MRFEDKLDYSIEVDSTVNTQQLIPTMILHTFCENALKHGLREKSGAGTIRMKVFLHKNRLVLSVEDDGIGREQAKIKHTDRNSTRQGLEIVQQQLEIFNKQQPAKAKMKVVDLRDGNNDSCGTRFELVIG